MPPPRSGKSIEQNIESLIRRKLFGLALEQLDDVIEGEGERPILLRMKADVCRELLDFHAAKQIYERLHKDEPEDLGVISNYAKTLIGCGESDAAIELTRQWVDLMPDGNRAAATGRLVETLVRTHHTAEARTMFEEIRPQGELPAALEGVQASLLLQEKKIDQAISCYRNYIEQLQNTHQDEAQTDVLTTAWFQLAKALDRSGDYDGAWAAAEEAHRPYEKWDPTPDLEQMERVKTWMTRETLRSLNHAEAEFEWTPLFIVGMPRSGTTLLEQILSMHQDVSNGGEMCVSYQMIQMAGRITDSYHQFPELAIDLTVPDCDTLGHMYMDACRPFASGTRVASNKALNLQLHLGFLSLAVPHSKAIMLYRHPLDNAVSCHTNNLVTLGHRYTTNLSDFGKIWKARRSLQEFWLDQLDMPMMELHYESMVQNQDEETRRLLDFIDVKWEPRCLDFHESTQIARTISWDQVNRKMYTTSDGRWKNYEKHLGPVIDEVQEYL